MLQKSFDGEASEVDLYLMGAYVILACLAASFGSRKSVVTCSGRRRRRSKSL